jgi:hypothetical protein
MAPQSVARGAPRSGDRAASGMPERAKVYMGRQQPATGSHLLWKTLLRPARSHHSRRRLSRIPSRKATAAPVEICSALP